MFRIARAACIAALALAAVVTQAQAQGYPNKPVRMIVPFAPGGSGDFNARLINEKLSAIWGQPVLVEYFAGANTQIGTDLVAKAQPDGYTLLISSTAFVVNPSMYAKLPYDPVKDFIPVTNVSTFPFAFVAANSFPVKNVGELIALERAKPGSISFGTSDSSAALVGYLFNSMAKTNMQSVSYKGAGPMMTDVAGGHVQIGIAGTSSVQSLVRAGRVRLIGIASTQKSQLFPDAPLIGQTVPGFEAISWFGLFAPRGTPQDIVTKIHRDVATVVKDPDILKRLSEAAADPGGETPSEFGARVRKEIDLWAKVAKSANIKPE